MSLESTELAVGQLDGDLYIDVQGRATQRVTPTLVRLAEDFLGAHEGNGICVELAGAEWIDSTFAGSLVRLTKRLGASGRVRLNHCTEGAKASLVKMRLEQLVDFVDVSAPGDLQQVVCSTSDRPTPDEIKLMMLAHEELAAVDEHNGRVFGPIAQMLRRQLESESPSA